MRKISESYSASDLSIEGFIKDVIDCSAVNADVVYAKLQTGCGEKTYVIRIVLYSENLQASLKPDIRHELHVDSETSSYASGKALVRHLREE